MALQELFKGTKVLELASVLAGPNVGQFFAELGAEVIKIENPKTRGDVTRSWRTPAEHEGDVSAYFSCTNWGKRSLSLDISTSEGAEIFYQLTRQSDFVIASYKPGDAEKLGVDYPTLSTFNKELIYGEITGYGPGNPKVGYDAVIQAESGFMYMNGEMNSAPTKMPVALIDILAGHQLKEAMLLAYIQRLKTGKGAHVSVSLIDTALASLANQGANWLTTGNEPRRKGSKHPNIAPYGDIFTTLDDVQVILAVGTNTQFQKLCDILGLHHVPGDADFCNNAERVKNRQKLDILLEGKIRKIKSDILLAKLEVHKVPAGKINKVSEALGLPGAHKLIMGDRGPSGLRSFVAEGLPVNFSHFLPPPKFGEHTYPILGEKLGLTALDIENLAKKHII